LTNSFLLGGSSIEQECGVKEEFYDDERIKEKIKL
jgi:hypothetical protein